MKAGEFFAKASPLAEVFEALGDDALAEDWRRLLEPFREASARSVADLTGALAGAQAAAQAGAPGRPLDALAGPLAAIGRAFAPMAAKSFAADFERVREAVEAAADASVDAAVAAMRAAPAKPRAKRAEVDPQLVNAHVGRLNGAMTDPGAFQQALEALEGDEALGAAGVRLVAKGFGIKARSKPQALKEIKERHEQTLGAARGAAAARRGTAA